METELNYIEIENTKDGFKTHAGVHTQLDDCLDNGNYSNGDYSVSFFWGLLL